MNKVYAEKEVKEGIGGRRKAKLKRYKKEKRG
jgi:hypothetical protein